MTVRNYKYKLYVNKYTKELAGLITSSNFAWNHIVELARKYYRIYHHGVSCGQLQKHMAKLAKRDPFWCKLGSQSMQEISQKYKAALDAHFDPKLRRGFPRTHKKFINGSIVYKQGVGYILGVGEKHNGSPVGVLIINKLGKKKTFKFKITRPWGEKIRRITIKRDNDGSLYLIVACDVLIEHIERSGEGLIGMDFGMKHFLTLSDGNTVDIPDYHIQALSKSKKADRVYSRRRNAKKYGSSFKRAKKAKFKAHRKVADKRANFHWKLAHELCRKYRFIAIEDLNLEGMKRLWGRKVSSLGFGEFVLKLMVVAEKYGTVVKKVDRFCASSKTCSVCGSRYDGVKDLSVREWTCPVCGAVHDRDVNAAKNILREALSKKENGKDVSRGVSGSKTQVGSAESAAMHTPERGRELLRIQRLQSWEYVKEEKIRKIVSETIRKILAENGLLQEMAVSSKEYKKKVNGLLSQIAENWCLIYFFRRTGKLTTCLNHWCTELRDALIPLSRPLLKGGDRESTLYKVWNENDFDNDFSAVQLTVAGKFEAEGISIKEYAQAFAETCKAFIMSTRPIVNVICKRSFDDIIAYIDSIGTKNILEESKEE